MRPRSVLILITLALVVSAAAQAGEAKTPQKKQELQFFKLAIDHAADLKLSDDQKAKLIKLRDSAMADFDKLKDDPDLKALLAQAREARKAGDQQKAKELHKQARDVVEKKGGDPLAKAVRDGEALLTADQLAKLKEIQSGKGKKAAKKEAPETKTTTPEKSTATPPPAAESKPEPAVTKQESKDSEKDEDREALLELLKESHPDLYERIVDGKE